MNRFGWIKIIVSVIVLTTIIFVDTTQAIQEPTSVGSYLVTHYSIPEGLPSKTITDVTFGKDGYLYLASVAGLIRMDGHHIDLFSTGNVTGLISNRISRIFSMSPQTLIIQDHIGNLYRFIHEQAFPLLIPGTETPISSNVIRIMENGSLLVADQKNLYRISDDSLSIVGNSLSNYSLWDVATQNNVVYLLNTDGLYKSGETGFSKIDLPEEYTPDLSFHSKIEHMDSHFRIIGRQKSVCYDPVEGNWCPKHSIQLKNGKTEILNIAQYKSNYLFATSDGFQLQTENSFTPIFESKAGLMYESIFTTEFGEILVGADGVWINNELVFEPMIRINDADVDEHGVLWISSSQDGLFSIRKNNFTNYNGSEVLNSYSIIKDSDNNYWAGSFENGLVMWNDNSYLEYNQRNSNLPSNTIRMISELKDGSVLVSAWGEPPLLINEGEIEPFSDFRPLFGNSTNVAESFFEDKSGRLWFGTLNGLFIKEGNRYFTFYDNNRTTLSKISKIVPSPFNDDLYFCTTDKGLVLLKDNQFHYLSTDLPATSQHVRDIYIASADTIWALAYNSGIQRFTYNRDLESFEVSSLDGSFGFESIGYHRIIPDTTGIFWISTNDGLLRVSEKGLNYSIETGKLSTELSWYREESGIIDREFNGGSQNTGFYDTDTHRIWFTNSKGLVSFDPYSFYRSEVSEHNFRIQSVSIQDSLLTDFKEDTTFITTKSHDLVVKYAHVSLSENQTQNIWVKRSDKQEWELPNDPGMLELSDLPTGRTQLLFGSADGSNVFSVMHIRVIPKLYETTYFRLSAVLIVIGFIFFNWNLYRKHSRKNLNFVPSQDETQSSVAVNTQVQKRDKVVDYIEEHLSETDLDISKISKNLGMSRSSLFRSWNESHKESITEYINSKRLEKASALLTEGQHTVTEVAHLSGFSSQSYFTKKFKSRFGYPPSRLTKTDSNET